MAEVTRRRFLVRSTLGLSAAAAGGALVAAAPRLLPLAAPAPPPVPTGAERAGPLVLHVRNSATGEVSLMVGTTETVYRDRDLVARLLDAAAGRGRR
jgi:hypothetical protein